MSEKTNSALFSSSDVDISTGSVLTPDQENEDEIIGYTEPWIARPGQEMAVKVSSTVPKYTWRLVRLIQGLEHENAPPLQREEIPTPGQDGDRDGRYQKAKSGSYAVVETWPGLRPSELRGVGCSFYVQPWLTECDHTQTLVSTLDVKNDTGFAIIIDQRGQICVCLGASGSSDAAAMQPRTRTYETGILLRRWRWAEIQFLLTATQLVVDVSHKVRLCEKAPARTRYQHDLRFATVGQGLWYRRTAPLTLAASLDGDGQPVSHFNGRLDAVKIQVLSEHAGGGVWRTWAEYDFTQGMSGSQIMDTTAAKHHGLLVNAPTRAIKGHDWDGCEPDWTKAKYGYGAVHFHEDDLDDAGWDTDFTLKLPVDAVSGAYAVIVQGVGRQGEVVEDAITFFVTPSPEQTARPKAAIILSTFTYLAYANEHMWDESRATHMEVPGGVKIRKDHHWRRMARRSDLGIGLYDAHRDGSGAVFSSSKRPILNVRPDYINWGFHRPREFSADLLMIGFLETKLGRGGYDVLTDHDLHFWGVDAVKQYDVIITGSHPEYPTLESLNAYADHARGGGSIMYLGGNGFYWCSAVDPASPHRIEVRRGDQGCRSFGLPAGERVHAVTGCQGGLWRGRGRNPQSLFGIGSCACGTGEGVPYQAIETVVKSKEFAWLWEGLRTDDGKVPLIGTEGFGGGASGDEIDRLDYELGSPDNTVLLAKSTGHDDSFGLFNEEQMFPMVDTLGTACDRVRSDMTYYETSGRGSVFSVGSINWYCSLAWNGYQNNVALLTWNVLREKLRNGKGQTDLEETVPKVKL